MITRWMSTTLLIVSLILACTSPTDSPTDSAHFAADSLPADSVLLVVAGDVHGDSSTTTAGACGNRTIRAKKTVELVKRWPSAMVVPMGDNTMHGTPFEFSCYNQTWGQVKDRTYPVIGNHELDKDPTATGYYDYFNGVGVDSGVAGHRARGYYTVQYGGWLILVANTNSLRRQQTTWMQQEMARNPRTCTMGIWHRPLFTSSAEPPRVQNDTGTSEWWKMLYALGADLILTGHVHSYERFAKMRPDGTPDPVMGIRTIIAGTGGANLYKFLPTPKATSEVRNNTAWGVVLVTLWPDRYRWQFITTAGVVLDEGMDTCH